MPAWKSAPLMIIGLALTGGIALAKDKAVEGVPIEITVEDAEGAPIPTAVIRHPDEADRHRVNAMTGAWEDTKLYMPDGSEMIFAPGTTIRFEISAPGYLTKIIQYDIRKRKNNIEIALEALQDDDQQIEEPLIQFGRDKPRD